MGRARRAARQAGIPPRLATCLASQTRPTGSYSDIGQRRGQFPSRPASPWGARRPFPRRLGECHSTRCSNRAIAGIRIASPGVSPTAAAQIQTAQAGRVSMAENSPVELAPDAVSHAFANELLTDAGPP
jgi:hypothetical protein